MRCINIYGWRTGGQGQLGGRPWKYDTNAHSPGKCRCGPAMRLSKKYPSQRQDWGGSHVVGSMGSPGLGDEEGTVNERVAFLECEMKSEWSEKRGK